MIEIVTTALILAAIFIFGAYVIYRICFGEYRETYPEDDIEKQMPKGPAYEMFRESIIRGMRRVIEAKEYEVVETTSVDGLKLRGRYYHRKDGAPLVLFFHGYKGNFCRDGNGIYAYAKKHEINLLLVSQRSQGLSEGKTITFGIMERKDCKTWIEYARNRFGDEVRIGLFGLSMGAATVMMAADMELPANVKGILADCGFSSPKEIICAVMENLKLPPKLLYPLAKLGAKWFGHFDLEEASATESMKHCNIPVWMIHNDGDDFVPFWMSKKCYEACASPEKKLIEVKGVGHGLSFMLEPATYMEMLDEFSEKTLGIKPVKE